jgi:hypothetical protein
VENCEVPPTLRSKRSCEGVNSQVHQEASHRHSAFDEVSRRPVEIASRDFPSYSDRRSDEDRW